MMWPIAFFRKRKERKLQESRLRQLRLECVERLRRAVAELGAQDVRLDLPNPTVVSARSLLDQLVNLRLNQEPYSLSVLVVPEADLRLVNCEYSGLSWMPIVGESRRPAGYSLVGSCRNPEYEEEMGRYEAEVKRLMAAGDLEHVDEASIRARAQEERDRAERDWKQIPMEGWQERLIEWGDTCGCCGGDGVELRGYNIVGGVDEFPCPSCGGSGKIEMTASQLRDSQRPQFTGNAGDAEIKDAYSRQTARIAELQETNDKLLRPAERAEIYVRICS